MVVFAIKTGTNTHAYLERKSIFFGRGAPATINMFALWRTPGAPDTVTYDTFSTPGALSQKTHTHLCPGGVLAIKKWPVLHPGAFQPLKMACFAPGAFQPLKNGLFCLLGRFSV